MKFTVSQGTLADAIAIVSKGVASASTLPILSGVLVRAADGVLEFQTSNYTISIRHRVAALVEEPGEMVIPCKMLANITKTLPDAPVSFETVERQVLITCAKSRFRLNTLAAADFPEFPTYAIEGSGGASHQCSHRDGGPRVARDLKRQGPSHPGRRAYDG